MEKHPTRTKPMILIVSAHATLVAAATEQLSAWGGEVRAVPPSDAPRLFDSKGFAPLMALVDFDALSADGQPMAKTVAEAWPDCRVVLVALPEQAASAASAADAEKRFDYVLTTATNDPARFAFLAGRTRQAVSSAREQSLPAALIEFWKAIRSRTDDPLLRILTEDLATMDACLFGDDPKHATHEVCSRLRRLENHLLLSQRTSYVPKGARMGPILIVEDDEVSGEMAKGILEQSGFEVIVAGTISAAKAVLVRRRPPLVLMDVHLGNDNGIEFVQSMRGGTTCPNTPVIIVTSDCLKDTVVNAVHARRSGLRGQALPARDPRQQGQSRTGGTARGRLAPHRRRPRPWGTVRPRTVAVLTPGELRGTERSQAAVIQAVTSPAEPGIAPPLRAGGRAAVLPNCRRLSTKAVPGRNPCTAPAQFASRIRGNPPWRLSIVFRLDRGTSTRAPTPSDRPCGRRSSLPSKLEVSTSSSASTACSSTTTTRCRTWRIWPPPRSCAGRPK